MIKIQDWMASIPDGDKHIAYVGEGNSETREFLLCGDGWETYKNWTFHLDMAFDPASIADLIKKEEAAETDEMVVEYALTDVAHLEKRVGEDGIHLTWSVLRQHTALPGKLWATLRAVGSTADKVKKSAIMVFEVDAAICATPAATPAVSEMEQMENRVAHMVDVVTYQAQLAQGALAETEQSMLVCQDVALEVAATETAVKAATDAAEQYAAQTAEDSRLATAAAQTATDAATAAGEAATSAETAATAAQEARSNAASAAGAASQYCAKAADFADNAATAEQNAALAAETAQEAARRAEAGGAGYTTGEIADYALAVADEDGNVALAIQNDGKVEYIGVGIGGTTTFDYAKCGLPVLYLTGDTSAMTKKDAVDLSYTIKSPKGTTIATGTCSCKWQGSSSVRKGYPKRNYTIELDGAVEATRAISSKDGVVDPHRWGEQTKYCLKANWIDPSAARNVVNAKLWGAIVASRENVPDKLAAAPNYGAIDGFPCIIAINGAFEGLYTFNIPKEGWMFGMGEGATEYVVCGEENGKTACGFYSTPTFAEDADEKVDFSVEYKHADVTDDAVIASFQAAVNAVKDAPNSADWETAVAPYFDIESAIDYYIFVCCVSGHDNLRRNTLYATYDGVKWLMSAYDLDTTYGSNPYGTALFPVKTERTQFYEAAYGSTRHRLFELIYKYSKDKLKARYWALRSSVLSDENVWYMFSNFVCQIPRAVYDLDAEKWADQRDNQLWPMPATTTANVENYMQYYRMHTALLDKEMEE